MDRKLASALIGFVTGPEHGLTSPVLRASEPVVVVIGHLALPSDAQRAFRPRPNGVCGRQA